MRSFLRQLAVAAVLPFTTTAAAGADSVAPDHLLQFNAGRIGIDRSLDEPQHYGAEFRFRPRSRWKLVPAIGAGFANNGAKFVYVDLKKDFLLGQRWYLTPSFGVGAFDASRVLDLGHTLEFRSGLEAGYRFANHYRVGIAIYHLSNGGLADENPGTEVLAVSLSVPL
ncbi:acyloxyacyl hydrolase [Kineobactrum salinum]|uniref:Acyloxyacyl hydrolase n=1 Tax=Kineobactrum salinum TaxID=2708301 RepID=A0A6C0U022_9GAMM|nr:acyloxyacyl hydrolase [Kineobactrum salinum]QIB65381.1 acyloxyacyl hydrolase [Kineobactrum salinum]